MEMIDIAKIQPIYSKIDETFKKHIKQYLSLQNAKKDVAGDLIIQFVNEDFQKMEGRNFSAFPNQILLSDTIVHYIKLAPQIEKKEKTFQNIWHQKSFENLSQIHKELEMEQTKLQYYDSCRKEILWSWANIDFLIQNAHAVSIESMKSIMAYGYDGSCGTPLMKEFYNLIMTNLNQSAQITQLQQENAQLKNEIQMQKKFT